MISNNFFCLFFFLSQSGRRKMRHRWCSHYTRTGQWRHTPFSLSCVWLAGQLRSQALFFSPSPPSVSLSCSSFDIGVVKTFSVLVGLTKYIFLTFPWTINCISLKIQLHSKHSFIRRGKCMKRAICSFQKKKIYRLFKYKNQSYLNKRRSILKPVSLSVCCCLDVKHIACF